MKLDEALQRLEDNGYSRDEAYKFLIRNADTPELEQVEGLKEFVRSETGLAGVGKRAGVAAIHGLVDPLVGIQELGSRAFGYEPPIDLRESLNQYLPETTDYAPFRFPNPEIGGGYHIPIYSQLLGGQTPEGVAGTVAGGMLPFGLAEQAIAPVAERLAGPLAEQLFARGASLTTKEGVTALARAAEVAPQIARAGATTAAGGALGALYSPDQPLKGAMAGGALGLGGGLFANLISKPLTGMEGNPEIQRAIAFVAKRTRRSVDDVTLELTSKRATVSDLIAQTIREGLPNPIDIAKLATPDEFAEMMRQQEPQYDPQIEMPFGGGARLRPSGPEAPPGQTELNLFPTAQGPRPLNVPGETEIANVFGGGQYEQRMPTGPGTVIQQEGPQAPRGLLAAPPEVLQGITPEAQPIFPQEQPFTSPFGMGGRAPGEVAPTAVSQFGGPSFTNEPEVPLSTSQAKRARTIFERERDALAEAAKKVVREARSALEKTKLGEERGSFSRRKKGEPSAPTDLSQLGEKNLRDLDAMLQRIHLGHDIAPESTFTDEGSRVMLEEAQSAQKTSGFLQSLMLPLQRFSHDPVTLKWYVGMLRDRTQLMVRDHARYIKQAQKIVEPFSDHEAPELIRAIQGLKIKPDGTYIQTETNLEPKYVDAAHEMRKLTDSVWRTVKGYDPRVPSILKAYGLEENGAVLRHLQAVQQGLEKAADPNEELLANKFLKYKDGRSMLWFDKTYDLDGGPYENGYYSLQPIPHMQAVLESETRQLQKQLAMGLDPTTAQSLQLELTKKQGMLNDLQKRLDEQLKRPGPMRDIVPRKQYSDHFSLARNPAAAEFMIDTNLKRVMGQYIGDALHKRYMDKTLFEAKGTLESLLARGENKIHAYTMDYINGMRGVKGFHQDQWIGQLATAVSKLGIPEAKAKAMLSQIIPNTMRMMVLTRLHLGVGFHIQNATQPWLTTLPFVRPATFARAYVRTWADAAKSMASRQLVGVWKEAEEAGVLERLSRHFKNEAGYPKGVIGGALDVAEQWNPLASAADWGEMANRVHAFEAFKQQALRKGFKPNKAVLSFIDDPKWTPEERAVQYGIAGTETTQFILSREGSPTAFAGGQIARSAGQFKRYVISYSTMLRNLAKYDKPGFVQALASLGLLGGLGAIPMYDTVRSQLIRKAGIVLPSNNFFSELMEQAGLNGVAHTIDITPKVEPFNLPQKPTDLVGFAGGPIVGSAFQAAQSLHEGRGLGETALKVVAPGAVGYAGGEAVFGTNEGMTLSQKIARGLQLRSSSAAYKRQVKEDLKAATAYGGQTTNLFGSNVDLAKEATRKYGIPITNKFMGEIRSELKREGKPQPIYK